METMATIRMSEAEVARDLHAVLAKVQQGVEIVIEQDQRPVAVLRAESRSGRPITEILSDARQRSSSVTLDDDFGNDLEQIVASHQQSWTPPAWD